MNEKTTKHPERIYLEPPPGRMYEGPMWCEDRIEPDWTEYVRADRVERLKAENERLREALRAVRAVLDDGSWTARQKVVKARQTLTDSEEASRE